MQAQTQTQNALVSPSKGHQLARNSEFRASRATSVNAHRTARLGSVLAASRVRTCWAQAVVGRGIVGCCSIVHGWRFPFVRLDCPAIVGGHFVYQVAGQPPATTEALRTSWSLLVVQLRADSLLDVVETLLLG